MTDRNKKRNEHLEKSADMIASAAFRLCKSSLKVRKDTPPDAKGLKDICSAVKEAIGICNGLDKNTGESGEALRIIMENVPEAYTE